jgi:hypothetical protein
MQVKVGNNEKAVYNCFITTIADKELANDLSKY